MVVANQPTRKKELYMTDFEPTIIAFVCNWCTYTAADLAGTSRQTYPQNVRMIRVMCTGMVDPQYIIKALLEGADGVLVSGCHPGDCHYINGNFKARRRMNARQLAHFDLDRIDDRRRNGPGLVFGNVQDARDDAHLMHGYIPRN